jgi:hypothetical protein
MQVKDGYLYVLTTADWRVVKAGFTTASSQRFRTLSYQVWRQFKCNLIGGYRRPAKQTDELALLAHLVDFSGMVRIHGLEWYRCGANTWSRLQKWLIRNGWEAIILPPRAHHRIHLATAVTSPTPPRIGQAGTSLRDARAAMVLEVMAKHDAPISVHNLALKLNMAEQTTQQYLARLILKGLVRVTIWNTGTPQQLKVYSCQVSA